MPVIVSMPATKADIIARLQKEILRLQGFKSSTGSAAINIGLGPIKYAFPNAQFPLGAIHEFICHSPAAMSATSGFLAGLLTTLMNCGGAVIWISASRTLFPVALSSFGIHPDRIIFIDLKKEKDVLWAMEESLKCNGLAGVIAETTELNFTASRRLQLAVEKTHVTGFVIRRNPRQLNATACIARWEITPLPSELPDEMPGVGFPRWKVQLLKIRNGKPGNWEIEWLANGFRHIIKSHPIEEKQQKIAG